MRKLFLILLISLSCFSQNSINFRTLIDSTKFIGSINRIDSFPTQLITPRTVDIWLPINYSKNKKYNVLYMNDGQMLFDATTTWNKQEWMVDEVISKLNSENKIEDVIVIAIWNIAAIRHKDLYPKKPFALLSKEQQEEIEIAAKKMNTTWTVSEINSDNYLKFIVTELKPYVDKTFSVYTDASHTAIMGSSMGGLISMYALCEYPKTFGIAACLSTHWIGFKDIENNPIPESFFKYMTQKLPDPKNHKIYFDYGTETLDANYVKYAFRVNEVLISKGYNEKTYKNLKFDGENHSEASWQKRIHIPIEFMFGK